MPRTSLTIHHVQPGDDLAGIAARYGLSSWQAIAFAPDNVRLLERQVQGARLLPGSRLHVPPEARALLAERVRALHRMRAMLQRHFETLERLHDGRLATLRAQAPSADLSLARQLLEELNDRVHDDVHHAHAMARDLAHINRGLLLTHLHDRDDLARYAGGDVAVVGLNWLLTPEVLELWFGMWSAPFWTDRWRGKSADEVVDLTARHLNLVRSKVHQQVDARLRQAHSGMLELERE